MNRTQSVFERVRQFIAGERNTEWYVDIGRVHTMIWRPWRWRTLQLGLLVGLTPNDRFVGFEIHLLVVNVRVQWDRSPEWSQENDYV